MRYTIWRKKTNHGKGDPSDGSEEWETEVQYYLVPEEKDDEHGEYMADEYGYQDYSLTVSFKDVAIFHSDRKLNSMTDLNMDELEDLGFERCSKCNKILPKGDNFVFNEMSENWLCTDCDYKETNDFITNLGKKSKENEKDWEAHSGKSQCCGADVYEEEEFSDVEGKLTYVYCSKCKDILHTDGSIIYDVNTWRK